MTSALEQIIKVVECERRQPMQVGFGYAFERNFLHDTLPWPICAPAPHTAHTGDGEGKHEGRFDGSSLSPPPRGVKFDGSKADRSAPEILEPMRRQLGVAYSVLDVLVTEPGL